MADNPESGQVSGMEEVAVHAARESHPAETSNIEALNIGLRLDQILNGMDSIMTRMEGNDAEATELRNTLNSVRERLERMEAASEKWEKERDDILQMAQEKSDNVDPNIRAAAQARASKDVQSMSAALKGNQAISRASFAASIKDMERVEIISPGKIVFARGQGGAPTPMLMWEEVAINGMRWKLPPNKPVKVPKIVAERFSQMRLEQEELQARKHVLSATHRGRMRNEADLAVEWSAINTRYGSPTEDFPLAGGDI
ncbi:MAG: hypothetical protein GQ524_07575 [Anaerolineales bacterium]|nr:hypothetical protein [Anaerolineales bacterium]